MELDSPSRFWSALGRIALILTVLGGAVGLWRNLTPRGAPPPNALVSSGPTAQLVGTIEYFDFDLPPNVTSQMQALRDLSKADVAEKFALTKQSITVNRFATYLSPSIDALINLGVDPKRRQEWWLLDVLKRDAVDASRFRDALNEAISPLLSEYARSGWSDDSFYQTPSYRSYVIVKVENAGQRQAVGVELQLPYQGIATIEEPGETTVSIVFDQKISCGTILPKGARKLQLWTSTSVTSYSFDLEKWQLTFVDGVGKVTWIRK